MGWMTVSMSLASAPGKALTAEGTEFAEDFLSDFEPLFSDAPAAVFLLWTVLRAACRVPFCLFSFAPSAASCAVAALFFFRSARAIASASHPAFTFPRDAGRLLVHSADPASPAICAMVRPVR